MNFFPVVFVGGLDADTEKADLEDFFRKAGPIASMWIARKPPVSSPLFLFLPFIFPTAKRQSLQKYNLLLFYVLFLFFLSGIVSMSQL